MDTPHVLLVEDNPNDVELALFALARSGLRENVHVVRDGEEALDYLFCRGAFGQRSSQAVPKLVLLDLKLPKITGLEVLREIKSAESTRAIPIVVMTSSTQKQDMVDAYALGANSYIQKPVDFQRFQSIIKDITYYWLSVNQWFPADGTPHE